MWWYKWVMMIRGCDGGGALPGTQKWMIMKEREREREGHVSILFSSFFFLKTLYKGIYAIFGVK